MEELKALVEMVSKLPQLALWVCIGFWAYKVIVIGSIYGTLKFVVTKLHDYLVRRKTEFKTVEMRPTIDGMCIGGEADHLIAQLRRVVGKGTSINSSYVHRQSVNWLREAIDAKIEAEAAQAPSKSLRSAS